ncbi:hypothetical protein ZIOFF_021993 [Zingiber officinale]|uniref:AB hydrolase-1 domain-containing protein n=1 Tax=Zingiber officinale TaxID=94328 RepID=A0A8J5H272_ZINOF|nr:hypothetical protein ZIOFF_021993 [Zingiber officinale]
MIHTLAMGFTTFLNQIPLIDLGSDDTLTVFWHTGGKGSILLVRYHERKMITNAVEVEFPPSIKANVGLHSSSHELKHQKHHPIESRAEIDRGGSKSMEWPIKDGEMAGISHRMVPVNGINLHVAEKGDGPDVVLLLHGFPELCYSWRHQIAALSALGYHAVAPDLRGFGDSDVPADPSAYTMFHVVGDLVALIESLGQDKVFVVGHDWGAMVAWCLCMFRPDKVRALVNMSVAFRPRIPGLKPVEALRAAFGDDYYICAFQKNDKYSPEKGRIAIAYLLFMEPGRTEAEFARLSTSLVIKKFLTYHDPGPAIVPKENGFGTAPEQDVALPSWLSEEDINYYASKFEKSGFTGGLNYYRALDLNWELTAPWTGVQIKVPVKFIVGDQDLAFHFPGVQDYIHNGGFKRDVPLLEALVVMEGVGHFINQEKPQEISNLIIEFFKKF